MTKDLNEDQTKIFIIFLYFNSVELLSFIFLILNTMKYTYIENKKVAW